TQGLKLTFKQRYSFTVVVQDPNTFYMGGGVLEASIDGSTWSDIGANAGLGYQTTALYAGLNNPLGGNTALAGKSPNYPAFQPATVDLGLLYAGKTVQFRFRVGASDYPTSALGWEIDDVQVSGAVVPPFPALVPQGSTCNHAPVASAGPDQTVNDGTTVTLDASGTTDPDGDSLSYQWVQTSGAPVALASSTTPHATFSAPRVRHDTPYTFAVLVNDGTLTASDSVTVTVQSTNHAPVAVIAPITSAAVDSKVTLDGSGSTDADNDTLSYRWTQTAGPHVALTGDLTAKPIFTMVSGTITLQLVASDGFTDSAPATVTIASTAAPGGCTSTGAQTAWMLLPLALLALGRRRKLA
ncbi:MAG: hypothetical protein JST92_26680, partial [Deltaproteobacteria bacterium]|nr:hypothetical protein [Deltaproteobacteria bacterium]